MSVIKGRARTFGDNINTDVITPAALLHLPIEELKLHTFSPIFKDFYKTVQENDIIVAGKNYGCGSSREQATEVVKIMGIDFIVCDSMARIYFRNCIALGMYPIMCEGARQLFNENDGIEINTDTGELKNLRTGEYIHFKPLTGTVERIRNAGGILPLLKQELGKKS